eukprot:1069625-Pyramimonas_sp.AAC.1
MTPEGSVPAIGIVPVRLDGQVDPDDAWPWDDVAVYPDMGRWFKPNDRCGFCGSWFLRGPWAGRCP